MKDEKGKKNKEKRIKRLEKYVGKLMRFAGNEWGDVMSLFSSLDEGHEVQSFITTRLD